MKKISWKGHIAILEETKSQEQKTELIYFW